MEGNNREIDHDLIRSLKEYLKTRMQKIENQQQKLQEVEYLENQKDKQPSQAEIFE